MNKCTTIFDPYGFCQHCGVLSMITPKNINQFLNNNLLCEICIQIVDCQVCHTLCFNRICKECKEIM